MYVVSIHYAKTTLAPTLVLAALAILALDMGTAKVSKYICTTVGLKHKWKKNEIVLRLYPRASVPKFLKC